MEFKQFAFKAESVGDDGAFSGYASVYNVKDLGGDVVIPGAFDSWLAEWKVGGKSLPILWYHDGRSVLGMAAAMKSDSVGLWLEGQLNLETVDGREKRSLLKQGAISGLSIGYDINPGGIRWDSSQKVYILSDLKLWEVSLVTFPMNESARVSTVKAALQRDGDVTVRTVERALKCQGFSARVAKVAAKATINTLELVDSDGDGCGMPLGDVSDCEGGYEGNLALLKSAMTMGKSRKG